MLLYGEEEEVEDKFYQIIRVNIKMELEKNFVTDNLFLLVLYLYLLHTWITE